MKRFSERYIKKSEKPRVKILLGVVPLGHMNYYAGPWD